MTNYIDGFVFPISRDHLNEYKDIAKKVAVIWKEYGALTYVEASSKDLNLEGTRSFSELLEKNEDEIIIFGWITFDSKTTRDKAHEQIANDSRMNDLVAPLMDPSRIIFDAKKMFFGGFESFIDTSR